jgi:ATP-dependent Lon protease
LLVGKNQSKHWKRQCLIPNAFSWLRNENPALDDPTPADLFEYGTLSSFLQLLKLPDGTVKVLVEGEQRAHVTQYA